MKNIKALFKHAQRLQLPSDLWQKIAEESTLKTLSSSVKNRPTLGWGAAWYKLAACLVLAVGFVGIGLYRKQHSVQITSPEVLADSTFANKEPTEFLDPDLFDWEADLGEVEWENENFTEEIL